MLPRARQHKPRQNAKPKATKVARRARPAAPDVLNQKLGPPEDKLARRDLPSSAPIEAGKALCDQVPRQTHGSWKRDKDRVDPLKILSASDKADWNN